MASAMIRPDVAEFDLDAVTPFKMLRSMSPALRGIVTNLHDALKELRACVFRAGSLVLTDEQIARQAWIELSDLEWALPEIIKAGFMARDDHGALFSPHLYGKLLRKEDRETRKAQADLAWEHAQETGDVPPGLTRKQISARMNGMKGGRCRKGESPEERDARRAREIAAEQAQRNMPLMGVVAGGKTETQNPNKKPNGFSVSENSVSSVSIDLEAERDTYIPSGSISGETQNPKPEIPEALVKQTAAKILTASGFGDDQVGYAVSFAKRWLGIGATLDCIVAAIQAHKSTMAKNGETPRRLKVFEAAVLRAIEAQGVVEQAASDAPEQRALTAQEQEFEDNWARASQLWKTAFTENRDFGAVTRQWPTLAQENGLPDIPFSRDAYRAYYFPPPEAA
ncbi:hypothetical protein HK16_12580 [Acetobacter senegalensis]|uniref:Uncharacterized protein n=2 Tax=Acetobacter senegalensis TaxID=446692 RepID=A0A252EHJ0_9PROT|nr:hypothetical protein HK16_12580 [Acetobacter senegalensis]